MLSKLLYCKHYKSKVCSYYTHFIRVCVCARTHAQSLNHVRLLATPWTVACQAPLSLGLCRQEYWSEFPGDLPNPGMESKSLMSPVLAGRFFTATPPGKPFRT